MVCSTSMLSSPALQQRSAFTPRIQIRSTVLRASPRSSRQVTRALSDTNLVISGATGLSLALGRFVFLDFQRDNARRQGLPVQNGVPHAEAGDKLSEEASFLKNTNDPAGEDACYTVLCSRVYCVLDAPRCTFCTWLIFKTSLCSRLQPDRRILVGCHWACSWLRSIGNHQLELNRRQPCTQVLSHPPTLYHTSAVPTSLILRAQGYAVSAFEKTLMPFMASETPVT